jgi:hypothetical protein
MINHEAPGHAGTSVTRSTAMTRRRLVAFCLLMGWALFAFSAVLLPLCHTVFGGSTERVSPIHGAAMPEMPCAGESDETVLCEHVTAAQQGVPDLTIADRHRLHLPVDVDRSALLAASVPLRITSSFNPPYPVASGARLYLRHQRLLI